MQSHETYLIDEDVNRRSKIINEVKTALICP